jgi:hypothetical protein
MFEQVILHKETGEMFKLQVTPAGTDECVGCAFERGSERCGDIFADCGSVQNIWVRAVNNKPEE